MEDEVWLRLEEVANLLGIMARAVQKNCAASKYLTRRVSAKGGKGGWKYEIALSSLPKYSQKKYLKKVSSEFESGQIAGMKIQLSEDMSRMVEQRNREQSLLASNSLIGKAAERDAVRHLILSAYRTYKAATESGVIATQEAFSAAYNLGQIDLPQVCRTWVPKMSAINLRRWESKIKKGDALGGKYGHRKGCGMIDQQRELRGFLLGMLAAQPLINGKLLHEGMVARFAGREDLRLPGRRHIQRWVDAYKQHQKDEWIAVSNPDAWKNSMMSAAGQHAAHFVNDEWQIDGTPSDLELIDGRHQMIGIIDVYSRRARLLVCKTAKATAVSLAIRRAIVAWGVPRKIKGDNGQEYVSKHQARVAESLGIALEFSNKFAPWEKPHIERFFGKFSDDIMTIMPGFVGHSVAERQEIRAREAFSERLFEKNKTTVLKLTAAELQAFCDRWCDSYHAATHSQLDGMSPTQKAQTCREPVRTISNERVLDLLMMEAPRQWCVVGKKGLTIDKHHYNIPDLAQYHGQKVIALYDPTDAGRVFVYGKDRPNDPLDPFAIESGLHFVGLAECWELLGLSHEEKQAKARETKAEHHGHVSGARKVINKNKKAVEPEKVPEEILAHREAQAANVVAFPKPRVEHATPGISAAEAAIAALDQSERRLTLAEIEQCREANRKAVEPLPNRPAYFANLTEQSVYIAEVMMGVKDGTLLDSDAEIIRGLERLNKSAYRAAVDILELKYGEAGEKYVAFRRAVGWPERRR